MADRRDAVAGLRLPWLAGPPVSFRGMRLLDATLAEAIPVHVAAAGATDMLVLQTRPHGVAHAPLSSLVARLTDNYLHKINPALVELRQTRSPRYDALTAELALRAAPSSTFSEPKAWTNFAISGLEVTSGSAAC